MLKKLMVTGLLVSAAVLPGAAGANDTSDIVVTAKKGRVATEVFATRPNMNGVVLSPDGTKVIINMVKDGQEYLAWLDLTAASPKPNLIVANAEFREAGDRTIVAWQWVGNDAIVLTMVAREFFEGERGDIGRLTAFDLKSGKIAPLAWENAAANGGQILHVDHDAQTILISRTYKQDSTERWDNPEVIRVNVKTGKHEMVMRTNPIVQGWFADSKGIVRGAFSYDRDSGKERLMYRSDANGSVKTLVNEADKDFTGAGVKPQLLLDEPDMAIVSDNKSGFARLYKVNMSDIKGTQRVMFQSKGYDVLGVRTSYDGSRPIGFSVIEQRGRTVWIDPFYKELQAILDERFGVGNAVIANSDRAEKKFTVFVAKPNQPGTYYIFDTVSGNLSILGYRKQALGEAELNPVSAFRYTASDGESIEAIMTWPRHRKQTTGLPLVILTHGGPFGPRDDMNYDDWAQSVAELGYVVVQPNYRGSGGYGAEWIKKGRSNGFGLRMQDDLDDVITHLAAQGTIDPARVCMFGWSYGGYASARAAQRNPEKYRCTIAGAGVYDLQAMRDYDQDYLGSFGSNYLAKGAAELSTVSPTKNAKGRWAPIMIVHGERDQRVPVGQGRALASALRSAGKKEGVDFVYLEQPKNTHNLPYDDVRIEWLKGVETWLTKHNPAYTPSDTDKLPPIVIAANIK